MVRVKRGNLALKRKKNILNFVKDIEGQIQGFQQWLWSKLFKVCNTLTLEENLKKEAFENTGFIE